MKKCSKCNKEYSLKEFHKKYGKPISMCKYCSKEYQHFHYMKHREERKEKVKQYRLNNPEKMKIQYEKRRKNPEEKLRNIDRCLRNSPHGVGLDRKKRLLEAQKNQCFICDYEFKSITEAKVDHDHISGMIRGILCNKCNSILGYAKDNINILQGAIDYLDNSV